MCIYTHTICIVICYIYRIILEGDKPNGAVRAVTADLCNEKYGKAPLLSATSFWAPRAYRDFVCRSVPTTHTIRLPSTMGSIDPLWATARFAYCNNL